MANLEIFRNDPSIRSFAPGEVIFQAGAPGDLMFVVVEGRVDLHVQSGKLIATVEPGDVFGEMALISDKPRSARASAQGDVRVAPIDARRFAYLVQNTPYFALEVMRTMAERVRVLNEAAHGEGAHREAAPGEKPEVGVC
jgi:CRP/FNR family cyclic AMP-dependent transcriptional regulator